MLFYTGLLFLVIAVSLDGFTVGMTYGMRNIHIPFVAITIIMACSSGIVLLSMLLGHVMISHISPTIAQQMGGIILIGLGSFSLYNLYRSTTKQEKPTQPKIQSSFKQILSTPESADIDRSGSISPIEAIILGTALSLDAFGAGFAASMLSYSPIITSLLVGTMSGLFVYSGIYLGYYLLKYKLFQRLTVTPPIILIAIGLFNIFF